MIDPRFLFARILVLALALGAYVPSPAGAQEVPVEAPTPVPTPTVSMTPIPYPAYGSPAPDVAAQQPKPGIPTSISLTQAIDVAVMDSPAFASERAAYQEIFARYGEAKQALLPGISGTATVSRTYGGNAEAAILGGSAAQTTSLSGSLNLQQLIFDGGRTIAEIRSTKEANIAGKDTLVRDLQTLADTVATQYYAVLEDAATVKADAQLVREFSVQEDSIRQQIRAGAAARSALAPAEFATAQAKGNLITAQGTLIQAQSSFATTLGLNADTAVTPRPLENTAGPKTVPYKQALSQALAFRPDYLAAVQTVESDQQGLRYARLARVPSIEGDASAGYGAELPFELLTPSQSLGATLTIPIYDQGVTNYNIAIASSTLDQANYALTTSRLQVESDVRGALAGLISARAALVEAKAEQASAQVALDSAQATYKVGAATITDLVTADANLATGTAAYIAALYGEKLAEETYTYALGESDLTL